MLVLIAGQHRGRDSEGNVCRSFQHIWRRPNELKDLEQNFIGLETARNSMHIAIMPEKQPKRPNNNAKALESWEGEGGTPASGDDSTMRKSPRDLNQITKAQPFTDHKRKPKKSRIVGREGSQIASMSGGDDDG
jgi:hypothetical protein